MEKNGPIEETRIVNYTYIYSLCVVGPTSPVLLLGPPVSWLEVFIGCSIDVNLGKTVKSCWAVLLAFTGEKTECTLTAHTNTHQTD